MTEPEARAALELAIANYETATHVEVEGDTEERDWFTARWVIITEAVPMDDSRDHAVTTLCPPDLSLAQQIGLLRYASVRAEAWAAE